MDTTPHERWKRTSPQGRWHWLGVSLMGLVAAGCWQHAQQITTPAPVPYPHFATKPVTPVAVVPQEIAPTEAPRTAAPQSARRQTEKQTVSPSEVNTPRLAIETPAVKPTPHQPVSSDLEELKIELAQQPTPAPAAPTPAEPRLAEPTPAEPTPAMPTPAEPTPVQATPPKTAGIASFQVQAESIEKWEKPALTLVFTGDQHGYIEPCGCSGLENKKGGLARRYSFLDTLRAKDWSIVPCDLGGQVKRNGPQAVMKFHQTIEGLAKMEYAAIALGESDLLLPAGDLVSNVVESKNHFCSANASLFGKDAGLTPRYRIVEQQGYKIGITSVVLSENRTLSSSTEIELQPAREALREILPELKSKANYLVLLVNGSKTEAIQLSQEFGEFHIVVTKADAAEPPASPSKVPQQNTLLIELGHKAMHAIAIGLPQSPEEVWKYAKVQLDNHFGEADPMKVLLANYQDQLKTLGLEGLGIRPRPHPSGRTFVGSGTCGECHTTAHAIWDGTPHAHALETLVELEIPRHYDPECLSCHVVGWEPQRYLPFQSGYLGVQKTPNLHDNGCENCHGPGSEHVAAEYGEVDLTEDAIQARRMAMRVTKEQSKQTCLECHDIDNSPDFDFDEYWPQVEHIGKY
ncbi:5'-nucleotidase/2' 3'-cyclic phosphodiesterase esterase-like protein [Planctomycetales bacterium 10988]|nr:5'-nucleotidase/2' 3'-cyclic phosphodiesterase esterase-like protein [Planctomycetales bacterium 10988]